MKTKRTQLSGQLVSACQLSVWECTNSSRSRKKHLTSCVALCNCVTQHYRTLSAKSVAADRGIVLTRQVMAPTSESMALRCPLCWQLYCPGSLDHQLLEQIMRHFTSLGLPSSWASLSLATRHLRLASSWDPSKNTLAMHSCSVPCLTRKKIPSDLPLICSVYEMCMLRIFTLLPECIESPLALGYSQNQQQCRKSWSPLLGTGFCNCSIQQNPWQEPWLALTYLVLTYLRRNLRASNLVESEVCCLNPKHNPGPCSYKPWLPRQCTHRLPRLSQQDQAVLVVLQDRCPSPQSLSTFARLLQCLLLDSEVPGK